MSVAITGAGLPAPSVRPLVIFSHGNSFPASTYGAMTRQLQARGFTVQAIEKYGHDPAYPVTGNWPHLVQQLADFAGSQAQLAGQGVWLVGHSLGGYLSLMCAARHPVLGGYAVKGVLLMDSPVIGGWRAAAVGVAKRARLVGTLGPGTVSRRRRHQWPNQAEVLAHFKSKKAFAHWDDEVLRDYIAHGTHDVPDVAGVGARRHLSFDREVETAIYNTLPHTTDALLKRRPLKCPVAFIGGLQSAEIRQAGMALTQKITHGRVTMLGGSHLFPMERPKAAAAAAEAALLDMAASSLLSA